MSAIGEAHYSNFQRNNLCMALSTSHQINACHLKIIHREIFSQKSVTKVSNQHLSNKCISAIHKHAACIPVHLICSCMVGYVLCHKDLTVRPCSIPHLSLAWNLQYLQQPGVHSLTIPLHIVCSQMSWAQDKWAIWISNKNAIQCLIVNQTLLLNFLVCKLAKFPLYVWVYASGSCDADTK